MHKFDGLGTSHFTSTDDQGNTECMKLRIHNVTLKKVDGRVCLFYKQFMRDKELLPKGGKGWPVFKDNADLDLSGLTIMPTKPVTQFDEVEKRLKVMGVLSYQHTAGLLSGRQMSRLYTRKGSSLAIIQRYQLLQNYSSKSALVCRKQGTLSAASILQLLVCAGYHTGRCGRQAEPVALLQLSCWEARASAIIQAIPVS